MIHHASTPNKHRLSTPSSVKCGRFSVVRSVSLPIWWQTPCSLAHDIIPSIQSRLECLRIDAEYLRANGMDLFHLGALGRLMPCVLSLHPSLSWKLTRSSQLRLYPRLDPSRPQDVAESIAAETTLMLRVLVAQFLRGLVRRTITLRELDFALCAHTKVWRLCNTHVLRPLHVRRALELGGGGRSRLRLSNGTHFGALLERFSEGEESEDSDDIDVPLAVRLLKGKAIARSEDEHNDIGEGDQELQQQVGPSTDVQADDPAAPHWSPHRTMYTPDLIAPAHPFGMYMPGTMPDPLGCSTLPDHAVDTQVTESAAQQLLKDSAQLNSPAILNFSVGASKIPATPTTTPTLRPAPCPSRGGRTSIRASSTRSSAGPTRS